MASSEAHKRANRKYYQNKVKPRMAAERASPDWVPMMQRPNIKANLKKYFKSAKGRTMLAKSKEKYRQTYKGWSKTLLYCAKVNSKKRGMQEPSLTVEWVTEQFDKGCSITGLPFVFDGPPRHSQAPSLDRIDNSRSYEPGNVRVVCYSVNMGLGTWGLDEYLRIAKAAISFKEGQT